MSSAYDGLASLYDRVQKTDTEAWADYCCELDRRFGRTARFSEEEGLVGDGQEGRPLLLDLGCGTGDFCLAMRRRGYDPIGIDSSAAMLDEAFSKAEKTAKEGPACLFLRQDLTRFELFGTVDLATCLLDTINHIVDVDALGRFFKRVANFLNPGGILIADLATRCLLAERRGNRLILTCGEDFDLIWENRYHARHRLAVAEMLLYRRTGDGCFRKTTTSVRERLYDGRTVFRLAKAAGLQRIDPPSVRDLRPPAPVSERRFVVLRRQETER